jgi:hypothetical protein
MGAYRRMPPKGLLHSMGNAARHIPGSFGEEGIVLRYQEGVVVLLQDDPARTETQRPSSRQLYRAVVLLIEGCSEIAVAFQKREICLLRLA